MNYLIPILVLGITATAAYFWGRRKNRWMSGFIAQETEEVLTPEDTHYVNIGGTIGYHFTYRLKAPFTEAKGTFTLLPRQSILYLPFSLLLGHRDRYFLTLFTDRPLLGEGHLVHEPYYRKLLRTIPNRAALTEERITCGGKSYVLLYDRKKIADRLKELASRLPDVEGLHHFCVYADNRNFYLFMEPVRGRIQRLLSALLPHLSSFFA
ncbi:hypothetical protein Spith_0653 [Spirochaeta thermophila DSM 6578]|uniref:Uncharacterized protein n=1 Tax=Winmispira thermophila (strain ATCC 700085 / DSM 6578 / Z-1203) TaxID=869211 RepID=G0GA97_WINT7|nr:hypothetical protein [Spirochaeta thermophila]AEJ60933.1 hypothetical protein Spith_0653 [Spirochaeta thermophila DSM 6578]